MTRPPVVLLLDDGELDDVQEILEELGVPFGRVRGGAIVGDQPPPTTLLVSTPRRILAVREPHASGGLEAPMRIVFVEEDSPDLRTKLREIGFEYLVRRPVHREALRLLILHGLYRGDERRREERIPLGAEVTYRAGMSSRVGTLAEISSGGCRLLTSQPLEPGKRIKIEISRAIGAERAFALRGHVLRRCEEKRLAREGLYGLAIQFDETSPQVRGDLGAFLDAHSSGPLTLGREDALAAPQPEPDAVRPPPSPQSEWADLREMPLPSRRSDPRVEPDAPGRAVARTSAAAPAVAKPVEPPVSRPSARRPAPRESRDRRQQQRAAFPRKIPAFGEQAMRVLVGRDLSVHGMRIEPSPDIELGERLHLAIYAAPGEEPLLVWGTVAREDPEIGMAMVFDPLPPEVAEKLETLVGSLPAVECLRDGEARAMGTVVSEILER